MREKNPNLDKQDVFRLSGCRWRRNQVIQKRESSKSIDLTDNQFGSNQILNDIVCSDAVRILCTTINITGIGFYVNFLTDQ